MAECFQEKLSWCWNEQFCVLPDCSLYKGVETSSCSAVIPFHFSLSAAFSLHLSSSCLSSIPLYAVLPSGLSGLKCNLPSGLPGLKCNLPSGLPGLKCNLPSGLSGLKCNLPSGLSGLKCKEASMVPRTTHSHMKPTAITATNLATTD